MNARLLTAVSTLTLCGLFATGLARGIALNTINSTATVHEGGRSVTLTGPVRCTQTERVSMRVTLTQRTTGAIAEGTLVFTGTTTEQEWQVTVDAQGDADFEPGPAVAVAVATTRLRGLVTDAHQWLVPVTLQPE